MDRISQGNISKIAQNATFTGAAGAAGKEAKAGKTSEPKDQVSLQNMIQFKNENLTPDGKVKVIIESKDPEKLAQLKADITKDPESKVSKDLPLINGFSAELDPESKGILPSLFKNNDVKVFLDGKMEIIRPVEQFDNDVHAMMNTAGPTMGIDKVWDKGFKGKGTTICIIDTGIAQHPDIKDRIIGFKDFVNGKEGAENAYDDQGHGTHCAGIAAGDGSASEGKYAGAAPEANLVGVKVLSATGGGSFSDIIAGVQWAVEKKDELGIDVISMSLGGYAYQSVDNDPVVQAVEKAVDSGIITVVAAGNSGPRDETIGTPAQAPHVLTVGAMDDKGTIERDDDTVAYFSSRGPTKVDKLPKPDVLTPGVKITAPKHTGGYTTMSGTSMATPMAAGMAALAKQAAPRVTPGELKGAIMGSADDLQKQQTPPQNPENPPKPPEDYPHKDAGAGVFDLAETIEKLTGKDMSPPPPPQTEPAP